MTAPLPSRLPNGGVTLSIRSIGFKRREVSIPANENAIPVLLTRDYFQLEAIVVTGQATGWSGRISPTRSLGGRTAAGARIGRNGGAVAHGKSPVLRSRTWVEGREVVSW